MCRKSLLVLLVAVLILLAVGIAQGRFDPARDPALLGWWSFDEGSGTIAADGSGNGNDGTLNGDPLWVPGVYGTALQFDGQNAYVGTGKSLLNNLTGFTMAGWVSAGNTGVYSSLFGQNDLIEFGFTTESGGQLGTWMAGNGWAFVGANYGFTYPSWHHLVLAGDETRIALYIDGQEQASDEGGMSSGTSSYFFNIGGNVFNATGDWFQGEIDDVWLFGRALTVAEIRTLMKGPGGPGLATGPRPADEAVDVPRDVVLGWTPGEYAATHDVYFGTAFDDVNLASRGGPSGVLVSQNQTAAAYDPAGLLNFGQTYYWRIDEVNAPPDSTILKGNVWSFTTEPFAYPARNITATTNGASDEGAGPENTVNGSGLDGDDRHSIEATEMWLATPATEDPLWIQYEFERVLKLHELHVWNYNVQFEKALGFGIKNATIEYSTDGATWVVLGDFEFAQATAKAGYASNTTVDLAGVAARYVRLVVNTGFGPMGQYGLSEVRFLYIPAQAREPQPADGAVGVEPATTLSWRAGREAASHEVHLGTDPNALTLAGTADSATFAPALEFGSTYYWQIVEVNEADAVPSWAGDVWSFSTQEYVLIDGFETYTDNIDAHETIFDTWLDGWVNDTGSTVGYLDAPFAEKTIVRSGRQSMPLQYDNSTTPFYSETEREFQTAQNWTGNGADTLVLYVRGNAPSFVETADGGVIMSAVGTDIWDTTDQFRYAYKNLTGDGSMTVRVDSLVRSNEWAKAGVMIRETLEPGSKHAFAALTPEPSHGLSFQRRPVAGQASGNTDVANIPLPHWVRLTRTGNVFAAQQSADGVTWTDVVVSPALEIQMAGNVYIGLALCSHDAAIVTAAEFSNLSTTGNVTGAWQTAEIGVAQPAGNSSESMYVTIEDAAGKTAMVVNADAAITVRPTWQEWAIPYSDLSGVNLGRVQKMVIGVGSKTSPKAGGTGTVYIDDIGYGRPAAE